MGYPIQNRNLFGWGTFNHPQRRPALAQAAPVADPMIQESARDLEIAKGALRKVEANHGRLAALLGSESADIAIEQAWGSVERAMNAIEIARGAAEIGQ